MKTINLELSNSGIPCLWIPCLWEEGRGEYDTGVATGNATIIAGEKGQALNPTYIKKKGHLLSGQHALVPVDVGCYIIEV